MQLNWNKCLNIEKRHFVKVSQLLLLLIVLSPASTAKLIVVILWFFLDDSKQPFEAAKPLIPNLSAITRASFRDCYIG